MTTQDLINYYKGLLILQYASQPNALATMDAIIGELVQDQIIQKVGDAFNLDTAIGAQLNILGTYRGVPRVLFGVALGSFWASPSYSDPSVGSYFGWSAYGDADPTWKWMQYNDLNALAYTLSDSQMRKLIKLKAAIQSSSMGLGDLDNILYAFFGTYVNVVDNEDMSIIYRHQAADPDPDKLWAAAVLNSALPHQAGVSFSVAEV